MRGTTLYCLFNLHESCQDWPRTADECACGCHTTEGTDESES
jgi:hypothetical protein